MHQTAVRRRTRNLVLRAHRRCLQSYKSQVKELQEELLRAKRENGVVFRSRMMTDPERSWRYSTAKPKPKKDKDGHMLPVTEATAESSFDSESLKTFGYCIGSIISSVALVTVSKMVFARGRADRRCAPSRQGTKRKMLPASLLPLAATRP